MKVEGLEITNNMIDTGSNVFWKASSMDKWVELGTFAEGGIVTTSTATTADMVFSTPSFPPPPFSVPDRPLTSPSDVLEAAADFIDEHGWTQYAYRTFEGVCSMGAFRHFSIHVNAAVRLLADWIIANHGDDPHIADAIWRWTNAGFSTVEPSPLIIEFNDTPGRTKEDVLTAFRKAAIWGRERVQ